jgi:uncharacterized protein (TIGR03435 family)
MTPLVDSLSGVVATFGISILTKATLALLMTLGVARLARGSRASVRHLLLTAGFGTLLVMPIAIVLAPSVRVEVAPVPFLFDEDVDEAALSLGDLDAVTIGPLQSSTANAVRWWNVASPELIAASWMGGVLLFAMPVLIGVVQVTRLRRTGRPWRVGQGLADSLAREAGLHRSIDVLLHESVGAPATCGIRRHAILFPVDVTTWADEDIFRAAVHEVEHVRRADCLVNAIARGVCAAYWFHPLVWVAWRRLGLEAERACDDAVLRRADADAYANQLVTLAARLSASARHPLLAMASRNDLVQRVTAVLDQRQARGHAGVAPAVGIASAACALIVTLSPLQAVTRTSPSTTAEQSPAAAPAPQVQVTEPLARRRGAPPPPEIARSGPPSITALRDQPLTIDRPRLSAVTAAAAEPDALANQNPGSSATPAFEVASIRRNTAGGVPRMRLEGGRWVASNASLLELIRDAYRTQSFQVVGGPEWVRAAGGPTRAAPASQRPGLVTFDILANIPPGTPPAQVPLMLRTLLADRFALVVHTEMRDMPVFVLTHARDDKRLGPRLVSSSQQCQGKVDGGPLRAPVTRVSEDGKPVCGMTMGPARIRGGGLTITFLANALTGYTGRMVVDRTGLAGPFDFDLTYAPAARGAGPGPSDDRPSIYTAVQEQLGLKLEAATAPVEMLVVESASMPSEN